MSSPLRRRDFRLLLAGQTTSALGDWLGTVAFMALVLELTQSSTAVAGILVLRLAPTTIAGPLAARLARRWDRRRLMMTMDLVRAGTVALVPFVSALWWIYLWAFLLEVASLVFLPARDAAIPDLVSAEDDLDAANGLVLVSSYATIPLGAGAFGAISALTPEEHRFLTLGPAFWLDAVTFLVSFALVRALRLPETEGAVAGSEPSPGFLGAFRIPLVRTVIPPTGAASLGVGALFSLGIVFVRDVLEASNTEFGVLVALFGVGAASGLGVLRLVEHNSLVAIRTAVTLQGSVISLMSLAPNVGLTFLGAVGFGAGAGAALASGMSFLQSRLRGEELVLAFATFHVVIRAALAFAAIGAGVAADIVDEVEWPWVGDLPATRLVLFLSGLVVLSGGLLARRVEETPTVAAGTELAGAAGADGSGGGGAGAARAGAGEAGEPPVPREGGVRR